MAACERAHALRARRARAHVVRARRDAREAPDEGAVRDARGRAADAEAPVVVAARRERRAVGKEEKSVAASERDCTHGGRVGGQRDRRQRRVGRRSVRGHAVEELQVFTAAEKEQGHPRKGMKARRCSGKA